MNKGKPYNISRHLVFEAFQKVKANHGAAGVDEKSIEDYEKNLKDNLYKLWNRMSSGSYMPKPVRGVEIPKKNGGKRLLGIPTVEDRVAQMVVRTHIEPMLEPIFLKDSYGYRPNRSAIDAIRITRDRCWQYNWVLEFDIRKLFDNIDHEMLMKALTKHTDCKWVLLYVERWLKAAFQMPDGSLVERTSGTPQGGVISPVLANLFMHYAFDRWMVSQHKELPWARYADDGIVHCRTRHEAEQIKSSLKDRLLACKLELHPDKTCIVYCKDTKRREAFENTSFDFLGYTFRPRVARNNKGQLFVSFSPAVSNQAKCKLRETIRCIRRACRQEDIEELADRMNPVIQGWINYFKHFCPSEMKRELYFVNIALARWAMRKYGKLQRHIAQALEWLRKCARTRTTLFVHWKLGNIPTVI